MAVLPFQLVLVFAALGNNLLDKEVSARSRIAGLLCHSSCQEKRKRASAFFALAQVTAEGNRASF